MKDFAQLLRGRSPGALLLLLALTILAACDGTSVPELIATYPRSGPPRSGLPPSGYPAPHPVSNAQLELAVDDAELAARQIADSAARFSGTIGDSRTWSNFNGHYARLTVLMPAAELTAFRRALARLGHVESERVEEVVGGDPPAYGQVTVTLHDDNPPFHFSARRSWNPLDTVRAAVRILSRFSAALSQSLASALLWLVAVAGPFVLMAVGAVTVLRWLVRRLPDERTVDKRNRGR